MLHRTLLLSSVALLVMATATTPARAQQDAQTQAMGRALFNEGVALFIKGDYDAACPKLEASLKYFPGLGTRGKLAECYEKQGRVASAWQAYRDVAQLAMRSGDPTREQVASGRAKALEPKLSYITVAVSPGNEIAGLVVKRNGVELDHAKLGAAEPIDAGNLTIEVSAPGRKTLTAQVAVTQGQSARFDVPLLAEAASSPGGASSAPSDELPVVYGDPHAWQRPLGLVLVGVGVVGLGVGGVLGLSAKSKYDGAFNSGGCDRTTKTCDGAGQSAVDSARSTATISTVLFVGGALVAAVGGVVFFTAPSSKPRAVRVVPTTYAGGAGLSLAGAL